MQIDSVRITRDSLTPADRLQAPHESVVKTTPHQTVEELILAVFKKLAIPNGGQDAATWVVTSKRPIAVISNQWKQPRILLRTVRRMEDNLLVQGATAYLHLCLYQDSDPDTLHQTLDRLSFPYTGNTKQ